MTGRSIVADDARMRGDDGDGDTGRNAGGELPATADGAEVERSTSAAERAQGDEGQGEEGAREVEELRDKFLRLAAEYDNYRKRMTRERQESWARAQADLVKQLIDPLDDLGRVAHVDPDAADAASVIEGVNLVEKKILKALSAAGLEVINPLDQTFNPELHEAVATAPALSREDDHTVAQVYQQGYLFKGQLLRPARVVVKQWGE